MKLKRSCKIAKLIIINNNTFNNEHIIFLSLIKLLLDIFGEGKKVVTDSEQSQSNKNQKDFYSTVQQKENDITTLETGKTEYGNCPTNIN